MGCISLAWLSSAQLAWSPSDPGEECSYLCDEGRQDVRQSLLERAHALRLEQGAVHVAEHVPKPQVIAEAPGEIRLDHRGTHLRYLEAHVRDDLAMPLLALGNPAVQLLGNPDEHALDAAVEIVQQRSAGSQRERVVVAGGGRDLFPELLQAFELVLDLGGEASDKTPRPGSQLDAFVVNGLPHAVGRRLRRGEVELERGHVRDPCGCPEEASVAAGPPPRGRYRSVS